MRGAGMSGTKKMRPEAFHSQTWLVARRDCGEDLRSRHLNEMQRFDQSLLVAVPELDVGSRRFRSVQSNCVRYHEGNGLGFGLANRASRLGTPLRAMHQLVSELVDQDSRRLSGRKIRE